MGISIGSRSQVSARIKRKGEDARRESDRGGRNWRTRGSLRGVGYFPPESWHPRRTVSLGHLRALISRCNQELHGPAGPWRVERPASPRVWLERDRLRESTIPVSTRLHTVHCFSRPADRTPWRTH